MNYTLYKTAAKTAKFNNLYYDKENKTFYDLSILENTDARNALYTALETDAKLYNVPQTMINADYTDATGRNAYKCYVVAFADTITNVYSKMTGRRLYKIVHFEYACISAYRYNIYGYSYGLPVESIEYGHNSHRSEGYYTVEI